MKCYLFALLYLRTCNRRGWIPNMKGLQAFYNQMKKGLRRKDGRMFWEEK